ncbi:MAG: hypothetical protein ACJAYU_000549 [Bradymonadia bacterium]|jgi:hypothetical protein
MIRPLRTSLAILLFVCGGVFACGGSTAAPEPPRASAADLLVGAAGSLGGECVIDSDCRTGFCDRTVPGGYCTGECETSSECGMGGHCEFGFCFRSCLSNRECRSAEFQCWAVSEEQGVCSFNVDAATPTAPNIGEPCRAAVECAAPEGLERFCIAEQDLQGNQTGYSGGMCVALGCEHDSQCGEGERCALGGMPYCVPACSIQTECRPGYSCDTAIGGCTPTAE